MKYRAVVFDVDGTLLDTRANIGVMQRAYHRMFPERDPLPYSHFVKCYSMTGNMSSAYLNIEQRHMERFVELLREESAAVRGEICFFDGMEELLPRLKDGGYILGVNTSRERWHLEEAMRDQPSAAWGYFDLMVTQEMVASPKPAPDSLLYIIERFGVASNELLFVGDSLNDGLCAQRTGCDFALAVWGCDPASDIQATYRPATPTALAELLL